MQRSNANDDQRHHDNRAVKDEPMTDRTTITFPLTESSVRGVLVIPESAVGFVIIACFGNQLAARLGQRGLATLELDFDPKADLATHAARLLAVLDLVSLNDLNHGLPIGLLGSDELGAAAVIAAAQRIDLVSAIACVDGRPELAGMWLQVLRTPTLLIVGSRETAALRANREVARALVAPHRVTAISGATRLFSEPGALDEVAATITNWFLGYAPRQRARSMQPVVA